MVKIRPFRVMLWSLLLIAAGGALIVYGSRVREGNRVTYAEMIEGMADMSQNRATQDNPPVLEIWDMGWLIMTIGVVVAIPGSILMLTSITTILFHRLVPDKQHDTTDDDEDQQEENVGRLFDNHGHEKAQREALDDDDEEEVGEELLHHRIEIGSSHNASSTKPVAKPVAMHEVENHRVSDIEAIDLVEPEASAGKTDGVGHGAATGSIELETDPPRQQASAAGDQPLTYDIQDGHEQNPPARP